MALVTDRDPHPMRPLAKPEPGETYEDPAFGCKVTRVTNALPAWGENAVIKPAYSTAPAWNADESKLLLWQRGLGHVLYDGQAPYDRIGPLKLEAPSDEAAIWWDPADPDVLYYPSEYRAEGYASGARFMRYSVSRERNHMLWDAAARPLYIPLDGRTISAGGDPQWISRVGRLAALRVGKWQIVYSIGDEELYLVTPFTELGVFQNAFAPSASGRLYQLGRYVYDARTMRPTATLRMSNPYEHGCPGFKTLPGGVPADVWNMIDFEGPWVGTLVTHRQATGGAEVVIGPATGYPYPPTSTHVSSIGPADCVAVGTVGVGDGQAVLDNEIVLADLASGRVARLAHARTLAKEGPWGYWSETHVNVSPSGTRVAWGSDWNGSASVDTYIVDLRES